MTSTNRTKSLSTLPTYTVSTARLRSLYSDFSRQKASNPASYTSNIEWWKKTLAQYVGRGMQDDISSDTLILHVSPEMNENLRHEGVGKPLCLAAVITELCHTRALIPYGDFLKSTTSVYHTGWLVGRIASYVVGKPLWWALEALCLIESDENVESEAALWSKMKRKFVVLSNLERVAEAVVERQRQKGAVSPSDALYSYDSFRKEFCSAGAMDEGLSLSNEDVKVLVKFLDRDKGVVVADQDIIKFIDPSVEVPLRTITAVDMGIVELKSGVENMEAQVEDLNRRISEKTKKATEQLRANRKEVALTHLKMRKQLEELLRKRLGSLEILQSTLLQVERAAQDIEIMSQYASSTATLRTLLAHPSLQRAHVEQTMEAMAVARAAYREVDEAIRLGGEQAAEEAGIDESELEAELAELVQDVKRETKEKQETRDREEMEANVTRLPSVPEAEPEREQEGGREGLETESRESIQLSTALDEGKSATHEPLSQEAS